MNAKVGARPTETALNMLAISIAPQLTHLTSGVPEITRNDGLNLEFTSAWRTCRCCNKRWS